MLIFAYFGQQKKIVERNSLSLVGINILDVIQVSNFFKCKLWFGFRLQTIFNTAQLPYKMMLASKVVKIDSKIIILL